MDETRSGINYCDNGQIADNGASGQAEPVIKTPLRRVFSAQEVRPTFTVARALMLRGLKPGRRCRFPAGILRPPDSAMNVILRNCNIAPNYHFLFAAYFLEQPLTDTSRSLRMTHYRDLCHLSNIFLEGQIMSQPNRQRKPELGLLAVLVAISDTGTVSAAADQLSLSQPAVSHALRRLRDITKDRLFERSGRFMVPTVCAAELVDQARRVINEANGILRAQSFDPRAGAPHWKIAASEYALWAFAMPLMRALRSINPAARVTFGCAGPHSVNDLLSGRIDLAFCGDPSDPQLRPTIVFSELYREHYIGVMCRTHPLAARAKENKLDFDTWLAWDHVILSTQSPGRSIIDRSLMPLGRRRSIGMASPSHRLNLECIKGSTLLLALPAKLVSVLDPDAYITFTLPLICNDYPYYLIHHKHRDSDPALAFMRRLIGEVSNSTDASQAQ